MGIYVKGMEMPKSCASCHIQYDGVCRANDDVDDIDWDDEGFYGRMSWCPLTKIPEKHGRLIDADDFLQRLSEKDRTFSFYHDGMFVDISDMNELLSSLKTVIEAEGGD